MIKARQLILKAKGKDSKVSDLYVIASVLLASRDEIDEDALTLTQLTHKSKAGNDMVALTALAYRRAGGESWDTFRAEARHMLGRQPLSGSVVVLVNNLGRSHLPLIAATK